jgi:hypothetical protein
LLLHFVLQAPAAQAKGGQSITPGALHVPCPSHVPAVLRRVPAHDGGTHTVSTPYFAHAPKPSQAPVWPHFAAPLSLQIWRGSGTPSAIGQQLPARPVKLHDTHGPWHAETQHAPSAQKPDAHSSPLAQLEPFILRPHVPFMHMTPVAQSALDAHAPKQSCFFRSHENGTHSFASPGVQAPAPSHVLMFVTAAPSQVPGTHTVPLTYLRHAPCPSQVPSLPHVATSDFGHVDDARGDNPAGTNEHTPIEPATSQRLHVSVQAPSQQTPSTQKPDWQSELHPHASPAVTRAPASRHVTFTSPAWSAPPSLKATWSAPASVLPPPSTFGPPSREELEPPQPTPRIASADSMTSTF